MQKSSQNCTACGTNSSGDHQTISILSVWPQPLKYQELLFVVNISGQKKETSSFSKFHSFRDHHFGVSLPVSSPKKVHKSSKHLFPPPFRSKHFPLRFPPTRGRSKEIICRNCWRSSIPTLIASII